GEPVLPSDLVEELGRGLGEPCANKNDLRFAHPATLRTDPAGSTLWGLYAFRARSVQGFMVFRRNAGNSGSTPLGAFTGSTMRPGGNAYRNKTSEGGQALSQRTTFRDLRDHRECL